MLRKLFGFLPAGVPRPDRTVTPQYGDDRAGRGVQVRR
jgi:hypothetical protein